MTSSADHQKFDLTPGVPAEVHCRCNHCSAELFFHEDRVGDTVNCPECGLETLLYNSQPPAAAAEPAQPAAPPPAVAPAVDTRPPESGLPAAARFLSICALVLAGIGAILLLCRLDADEVFRGDYQRAWQLWAAGQDLAAKALNQQTAADEQALLIAGLACVALAAWLYPIAQCLHVRALLTAVAAPRQSAANQDLKTIARFCHLQQVQLEAIGYYENKKGKK